ncbi:MAG: cation-transporting P-type ATPase [Nitrospiraceae bacterium]|nr:cation-transporting P-type ATPase [Nitrospiraceae bacterium]
METLIDRHWHHLPADEVLDLLESDREKGLDIFEVENRQKIFGPNVITGKKGKGPLLRFLLQFHQPLIYILLAAGAITALLQEWVDAGVIFGVVLVNAVVGFIQEAKAVKAIEALARTMTTEATVMRAGEKRRISSAEVVPGDIVILQSGDKVPADMRLFQTRELQVDESALTGESVPVGKRTDVLSRDALLADWQNMAFASTLVTYGQGIGGVVATGDGTEVGRISQLISAAAELETPLTRKIAKFSHLLLYAILALAAVTFVVGLVRGQAAVDMFMAAVALAVGAIPEGLPAAMTITLAIGVSRMARQKAIIRKLPAVETLGSTTVICSDKTGTLTENQMTVQEIAAGGERFVVSGAGYAPSGKILKVDSQADASGSTALTECLRAGLLCNDSTLIEKNGRWKVHGDPTEGALIVSAIKGGLSAVAEQKQLPRIDAIPFESQHQYMATLHDKVADNPRIVYVKGSTESVLERCSSLLNSDGQTTSLDKGRILTVIESMATKGLRVIAFAKGELKQETNALHHADISSDLTFVGLQGMIDPPRAEAMEAVKRCYTAGIHVKMITGDHALTASAIAGQIGLNTGGNTITGKEMAQLSDRELIAVASQTAVFARVTPDQKLRLVEALQAKGNIVAMTGDGVNDAPALKRADIGVAMGITGTEVAKEAADMVLTDDNFSSIEAAVEEGRGVFDNLTKFIIWTLPTNLGEGLVILVAIFASITLPILPVQILWINMTTAVLLGLMLAFEPKEPSIMMRPPRDPKTPILTRELIGRIFIVGTLMLAGSFGLFEWELMRGSPVAEARTVAVNVFVMTELFYLFNCRSLKKSMFQIGLFSNLWLWGGVATMLILQVLYTYLPAMNWMFHSAPIGLDAWGRVLAVSVIVFFVVGFEKLLRRGGRNRENP